MSELRTAPIPELAGLAEESAADNPGRYRTAKVTLTVWVNETGFFEVEAETTYLHKEWHDDWRGMLAEEVKRRFEEFLDDEFSE